MQLMQLKQPVKRSPDALAIRSLNIILKGLINLQTLQHQMSWSDHVGQQEWVESLQWRQVPTFVLISPPSIIWDISSES